jgi:hypothetical protein
MWGQFARRTSCGAGFASAVDAVKRAAEFLHHGVERDFESGAPSDQHVIVAGLQQSPRRKPNELAQAAPHPVALDGIADLFADGETDPRRTALPARTGLQNKAAGMSTRAGPGSLGGGPKLTPPFQPLHCSDFGMTGFKGRACDRWPTETPSRSRSGTQSFAAPCAPRGQNFAAAFARHASAKAMAALAYELARLIGPFHGDVSAAPLTAAISRRDCGGL